MKRKVFHAIHTATIQTFGGFFSVGSVQPLAQYPLPPMYECVHSQIPSVRQISPRKQQGKYGVEELTGPQGPPDPRPISESLLR